MICPKCGSHKHSVTVTEPGFVNYTKRFCKCSGCGHKFITYEVYEEAFTGLNVPKEPRIRLASLSSPQQFDWRTLLTNKDFLDSLSAVLVPLVSDGLAARKLSLVSKISEVKKSSRLLNTSASVED